MNTANPKNIYYAHPDGTSTVRKDMRTYAFRIGRLELCSAWLVGHMPTWFYFHHGGKLHSEASSTTLRIFRAMIGYRWYRSRA